MGFLDLLEASAEGASAEIKRDIVDTCLHSPSQLHGIADALMTTKGKLQLAAAEVLAEVAKARPELCAPHIPSIMRIADEKNAKTSKIVLGVMAAAASSDPSGVARYQKELEAMARGGKLAEPALSVLAHLGTASPRWAGAVRPTLLTFMARSDPAKLPSVLAAIAPAFLPNAERELTAAVDRRLNGVDPAIAAKAHEAIKKAMRKRSAKKK